MSFTPTSATDLAALFPVLYGRLQPPPPTSEVAAKFFTDVSADLSNGGDTVKIANLARYTANDRTAGSIIDTNTQTLGFNDLVINVYKNSAIAIDYRNVKAMINSPTQMEKQVEALRQSVIFAYETSLLAAVSSFPKTVGATTASITDAYVLEAVSYLHGNDFLEDSELGFFFNATAERQLRGIDKYTLYINSGQTVVVDGKLGGARGELYGIKVYITNRLPANTGLLAHKDSIYHARLLDVMDAWDEKLYQSVVTNVSRAYGVKLTRNNAGVRILHS